MGDKLTKQDKGFVEEVITTGNATQAVKNNYGIEDDNYAGVKGHDLLRKPKIQQAIQSLAERIDEDKLFEVLNEGLEAGKTIYKNNNATKQVEEVGYEADYAVRHKYLDSALKIKGSYAPDKNINININQEMTPEAKARAEAFDVWFKAQQKQ